MHHAALLRLAGRVLVLAVLSAGPAVNAATYEIDPVHSMVIFKVGHLGVSNNYGRFNDIGGRFDFDPHRPGQASFRVEIKADSVDTHNERRDQHLRSPDFLNAKQFPVIALKSKSVERRRSRPIGSSPN